METLTKRPGMYNNREYLAKLPNEVFRRSREKFVVALRKEKRIGMLVPSRKNSEFVTSLNLPPLPESFNSDPRLTDIEKLIFCKRVLNESPIWAYHVLKYLADSYRKQNDDNLIPALMNINFTTELLSFLDLSQYEENIREASYLIKLITSGSNQYIKILYDSDAIRILIKTLSLNSNEITINALIAISNIVSESQKYWQLIIELCFIQTLYQKFKSHNQISEPLANAYAQCLYSISNGKESICPDECLKIIEISCQILKKYHILEIFSAFYCISANTETAYTLCEANLISTIMKNIGYEDEYRLLALKTLSNIAYFCPGHIQVLINSQILDSLQDIILCDDVFAGKHAFWLLSNIAGDDSKYCEYVLEHMIFPKSLMGFSHYHEEIRTQASHLLKNCCIITPLRTAEKLLECNGFVRIAEGFIFPEPEMLCNLLESIDRIFDFMDDCSILEQTGILHNISKLVYHINQDVKNYALSLSNRFFTPQHQAPVLLSSTLNFNFS